MHTNYTANIIQTLSITREQKQSHTIILPVNTSAIDGRLDFESTFPSLENSSSTFLNRCLTNRHISWSWLETEPMLSDLQRIKAYVSYWNNGYIFKYL